MREADDSDKATIKQESIYPSAHSIVNVQKIQSEPMTCKVPSNPQKSFQKESVLHWGIPPFGSNNYNFAYETYQGGSLETKTQHTLLEKLRTE